LELENGGVEKEEEFRRYRETYQQSDVSTREFLDKARTDTFLQLFRYIFDKHMLVKKWRSPEILHYILGGDPRHAKEFARWLLYHKTNEELKNAAPTNYHANEIEPIYTFLNQDKNHHTSSFNENYSIVIQSIFECTHL
jgi:hypothetical protein